MEASIEALTFLVQRVDIRGEIKNFREENIDTKNKNCI